MQESQVKQKGDKVGYYNDGYVKWIGGFTQIEYSDGKISSFLNLSAANSAYKRIDYFKKKDLVLDDTTFTEALEPQLTQHIFLMKMVLLLAQKNRWLKIQFFTMDNIIL